MFLINVLLNVLFFWKCCMCKIGMYFCDVMDGFVLFVFLYLCGFCAASTVSSAAESILSYIFINASYEFIFMYG